MKKCWDENPLKRPNTSEINNIIEDWILNITMKDINEESKNIVIEFYKADKILEQKQTNTPDIHNKSHSQAYHTSRLLDFTKKLNEILDEEDMKIYGYKNDQSSEVYETGISQSIGNYHIFIKYKKL